MPSRRQHGRWWVAAPRPRHRPRHHLLLRPPAGLLAWVFLWVAITTTWISPTSSSPGTIRPSTSTGPEGLQIPASALRPSPSDGKETLVSPKQELIDSAQRP